MFKKAMLFAIALISVSAITGCSLPFLGGGSKETAKKVEKK